MSNSGLQTYDTGYATPSKSSHSNQSKWMNRWVTTTSNSILQVHDNFSLHGVCKGKDLHVEDGARLVQIAKPNKHKELDINAVPWDILDYRNSWRCQQDDIVVASNDLQCAETVEVVTEAKRVEITYETLVTNPRNLRNSNLEMQPISVFNFSERIGSILAQKRLAVSIEHESDVQTEGISKNSTSMEPSNGNFFFKALRPAPTEAAFPLKEYHSRPEGRLQCQSAKPYISLNKSRTYNGELGDRLNNLTSTGVLPSGQVRTLEELNKGCHSSSDPPHSAHNIDELRLFSSVGTVEDLSRGPKFSQTTKQISITDVSRGKQILRPSPITTKFKESTSQMQFTLLPDLDRHDECSDKHRPLVSSRSSEGKKYAKDEMITFLASKNESSSETDTMDIDVCQTCHSLRSGTSSSSYKDTMVGKNPAIYQSTISRDKLGSKKRGMELPDINREPPSHVSAEQGINNMNQSMSRTESLDAEHLHVFQAGNSNSSPEECPRLSPDPSSRWVKRLKLTSSDYHAHGTKNVNIGDSSIMDKAEKSNNKGTDNKGTNPRAIFSELFGEEVGQDKMLPYLRNNEPTSMESKNDSWGLNLSHPWIQRWCHNQAPHSQKAVASVAPKLDISKTTLDEYQTKQFPSIAAMALMGKTMNGLQACKFQNKGSFVVWGTGEF